MKTNCFAKDHHRTLDRRSYNRRRSGTSRMLYGEYQLRARADLPATATATAGIPAVPAPQYKGPENYEKEFEHRGMITRYKEY